MSNFFWTRIYLNTSRAKWVVKYFISSKMFWICFYNENTSNKQAITPKLFEKYPEKLSYAEKNGLQLNNAKNVGKKWVAILIPQKLYFEI